ncbi:hypothetical protein [Mesorhizobium sp. DCY119]|uniref:hypothetical protein n=1 Tax=Mesorhizobium sp. DCY119 TaxID=2108445 RepID=UPI000E756B7E|nr:hypothetical protein [Mesorhizobium sp. DCY119]RJG46473.1 hypothetical protein D3Y55_20990 [Mesorhizobium sp. DCY119]
MSSLSSVKRLDPDRNPFQPVRADRPFPPIAILVSTTLILSILLMGAIGITLFTRSVACPPVATESAPAASPRPAAGAHRIPGEPA